MENIKILKNVFIDIINLFNRHNMNKIIKYMSQIPLLCEMNEESANNRKVRDTDPRKYHPIKTRKGDIFNANITENVGSELSENHLVVVIQGRSSNIYGEKVTILPIEGDGGKINPHYQMRLTNADLETGRLDKPLSRIIFTDVTTIDKARLNRKIGTLKAEKIVEVNRCIQSHLEIKNEVADKIVKK